MIFGLIDFTKYYFQLGKYSKVSLEKEATFASKNISISNDKLYGSIVLLHYRVSFNSWLIMYYTNSIWSHTSTIIENGQLLDVTTKGVIIHPFSDYLNDNSYFSIYKFNIPNENEDDVKSVIEEMKRKSLGNSYGWGKIFYNFMRITSALDKKFRFRIGLDTLLIIVLISDLFKFNSFFQVFLPLLYIALVIKNIIKYKYLPKF